MQIVTSAFRPLPAAWAALQRLNVVVSIDGLRADHDVRRAPATYDKILENIQGQKITIHCTVTGQMMKRPGYLDDFMRFWVPRAEIRKVWFSLFTPQIGDNLPEMLTPEERTRAIAEMTQLRTRYPKLDMRDGLIRQFATPPQNPQDCVFALTTRTVSADLTREVTPCQYGGNPDCHVCGCVASMGLAAIAAHKLGGLDTGWGHFQSFTQSRASFGSARKDTAAGGPESTAVKRGLTDTLPPDRHIATSAYCKNGGGLFPAKRNARLRRVVLPWTFGPGL